jgi:hypothetical protein
VASTRGDQVVESAEPGVQTYDWPLFVGKRWRTTFTYTVVKHGRTFRGVTQDVRVDAYEDVQTPAGTFKAFKITRGDSTHEHTYWLSPELGVWVKWRFENNANNYLGAGTRDSELISLDLKQ